MVNSFQDKIVVVTGGAQGIGKNIARAFAQQGAQVIIADKDVKSAKGLTKEFNLAEFISINLAVKNAGPNLIRRVVKRWRRVDILVNNARQGKMLELLQETEQNWDDNLSVALKTAFFASQEAIRLMAKKDGCSIVNIGSVAGERTCHQSPSYHCAKAALAHLTRYLATYAGPLGVRVNAVVPGFIIKDENQPRYQAKSNKRYREIAEFCHPLRTVGTSDDVAQAVLFLASDQAKFITGQCLVVDGGLILEEQSGLVYRFAKKRK